MIVLWLGSWGCSETPTARPTLDLGDPAAQAAGRVLFHAHCAICHGERADGHGLRQLGFEHPPANFSDPSWRERCSPERAFETIRHGRVGTAMPAWHQLSDEQIWQLVAYLRSVGTAAGEAAP
jgi:high-affinity iron transporter